ncbi:MAG: TolC family protein [Sediminibacterium sp.]|nr:TolC family protein [uncultured Sediminibacterium sp.]
MMLQIRSCYRILLMNLLLWTSLIGYSQTNNDPLYLTQGTLDQVIQYALKHQPTIKQAEIDQEIVETTLRNKLSAWYPQLNFNYSLQHNFQVPTNIIGGNPIRLGVNNTSNAQFNVSQNIFNRDALLANRSQADVRNQAKQQTGLNKVELVAGVSKAFYDVLATMQQIKVADENITRIQNSLAVATNQYKAGIADKTDYKRATILLNNTRATRSANQSALEAKISYLKNLMGYPDSLSLPIQYDSLLLEKEVSLDTLQVADATARPEYVLLQTQQKLLNANLQYEKWSFLPQVSLNGAYNLNYQNNQFSKLYSNNFPNSFAALTLSFPLLQGGKRKANIDQAGWQIKRKELDILQFKQTVNTQYAQALAAYKASYSNFTALKENLDLAKEVYGIIDLQYKAGVKTYLEVITAETDLRTSQINYYNALYLVLASKVDVKRALGQINY